MVLLSICFHNMNGNKNWLGSLIFEDFDPCDRDHELYGIETDLQIGSDAHILFLAAINKTRNDNKISVVLNDIPEFDGSRVVFIEAIKSLARATCTFRGEVSLQDRLLWDMGWQRERGMLKFIDGINMVNIKQQLLASKENQRLAQEIKIDCQAGDRISF